MGLLPLSKISSQNNVENHPLSLRDRGRNQLLVQPKKLDHTPKDHCPCPSTPSLFFFHILEGHDTQYYNMTRLSVSQGAPQILPSGLGGPLFECLTGSIILRSGRLSDLISQLQELTKGVNEAEISPDRYDSALLAAQIRQLAQEIRELTVDRPITIFNGNSTSNGSYGSYLLPAAALGAMGYCYMWWKGWSLSNVMFVTKHNMANAVATVSKQLEHVSEALASTKRHLTKRLENLDWKLDEQKEISQLIASDVSEAKSNLNQIGYDIEIIHQMVSGLEGKIELLESKQDVTNSGLWYLCQVAGGIKDGLNPKLVQGVGAKLTDYSSFKHEDNSLKGLQFIAESNEPRAVDQSMVDSKKIDASKIPAKSVSTMKARIHRSYPVGISLTRGILSPDS